MAYENTTRKQLIRIAHDLPILESWHDAVGHPLSYFGLTGPDLYDIEDWKSVLLGGKITSVEENTANGRSLRSRMISNADILGVSNGFQVLLGKIEDIVTNAKDDYSTIPQCHRNIKGKIAFEYDVVNLDFDGGIGNTRERIDSIASLIFRESSHGCVLFISISPRSHQSAELQYDIAQLARHLSGSADIGNAISWYNDPKPRFEIYRLKALVPLIVHDAANLYHLKCESHVPITYVGHANTRMLHFAFTLSPQRRGIRGATTLTNDEALLLPMLESVDEGLRLSGTQVPGVRLDLIPSYLSKILKG